MTTSGSKPERDPLAELQAENARLTALLEAHGIEWRQPPKPSPPTIAEPEPSKLSTADKVALFRRLFRGRTDVYPVRWESKTTGKSGYAPACDARRLGTAIISHTCTRRRQLKLTSYDRLFPSQDTLPKGGFGNLIALPLQRAPRDRGHSVFVDGDFRPYPDQWSFLVSIRSMSPDDIEPVILNATGGAHPLDVRFIDDEDHAEPWKRPPLAAGKLPGPMPRSLTVTLANLVYFEKAQLPQPLANRLIRLAAFQNPEFYRAQAMRLPVWNKPRASAAPRVFPATSPCPAAASTRRKTSSATTASTATCGTSGLAATHSL